MALRPAFGGYPLDRADALRGDPARLAELAGQGARRLRLDGLVPELDGDGRLTWDDGLPDAASESVFLGLGAGPDGAVPHFAAAPAEGDADPAYARQRTWSLLGLLAPADLALYGGARSVLDWHARHRFCANCGHATRPAKAGWQRDCVPKEAGGCGASHFPRVDPVAIMLVEHDGALLLGRGKRFPERRYSALAGFVEPGESIEEAVAREVFEEAGVRVRDVAYIASQPWPFPSQLMIGCIGFADSAALTIDPHEIEDARWYSRAEVAEALDRGEESPSFIPPPRQAIARSMLEWWLEERR